LLDGGEIVILALKPSLWYILFSSARWILAMGLVIAASPWLDLPSLNQRNIVQISLAAIGLRVGIGVLQWACRLYVLTNRRIMRIRGVFHVDIFECSLNRIQNTFLSMALHERLTRLGTISFATAGTAGVDPSWVNVPSPLDVHEKIRQAIRNVKNGAGNP
jgi:hypothetical protein